MKIIEENGRYVLEPHTEKEDRELSEFLTRYERGHVTTQDCSQATHSRLSDPSPCKAALS